MFAADASVEGTVIENRVEHRIRRRLFRLFINFTAGSALQGKRSCGRDVGLRPVSAGGFASCLRFNVFDTPRDLLPQPCVALRYGFGFFHTSTESCDDLLA